MRALFLLFLNTIEYRQVRISSSFFFFFFFFFFLIITPFPSSSSMLYVRPSSTHQATKTQREKQGRTRNKKEREKKKKKKEGICPSKDTWFMSAEFDENDEEPLELMI